MSIACVGIGAPTLHAVGLWRDRCVLERTAIAFAVGFGLLGWLVFWLAICGGLGPWQLGSLVAILSLGNYLHRYAAPPRTGTRLDAIAWILIGLTALALFFDLLEATAPPVDADSLAYHFEVAKRFAENGRATFIPWAFTGAIPLLVHMTYTLAYAIGGELSLTLWTFMTSVMGCVVLYVLLRRWLSLQWSLAIALLCLTAPAMIYSGGAGHAEPRLALFVLTAVYGLLEAHKSRRVAPILLIGLGAGFFAASKYTGLLFIIAAGIGTLTTRAPWLRAGLVFCIAAAVAGLQWYGWNFAHTGDPIFPMLFSWADRLGLANHVYWTNEHAAYLKTYLAGHSDPVNALHRLVGFPIIATLFPLAEFESGRVGLGPFALLIAPLALWSVWTARHRIRHSALLPVAVTVLAFYVLWMEFGGIPKVRHLLPMYPALMICITVAALRTTSPYVMRPVALASSLSLAVNFAALVLFSLVYVSYHFTPMTRDQFLARLVPGFDAIHMINGNPDIKYLVVWDRQLQYYIEPPTFFASGNNQNLIDMRVGFVEPGKLFKELQDQKVTHLLLREFSEMDTPRDLNDAAHKLADVGCLVNIDEQPFLSFGSRTIKSLSFADTRMVLWKLSASCDAE